MSKKTKKKIIFMLVLVIIFMGQFTLHNFLTAKQKKVYLETYSGMCVKVHEACMNVYEQGKGDETIVLMSDYGVSAPSIDYQPLIDELSKKYRVIVPENFGYGFSDVTHQTRNIASITEDLHSAINQIGVSKYILLSSGFSNVYATYYINKYQSEVSALVGLDPTIIETSAATKFKPKTDFDTFLTTSGLIRTTSFLFPSLYMPMTYYKATAFSKEELKIILDLSAWTYSNENLVQEGKEYKKSIEAIRFIKLPKDFPILYISSITELGQSNYLSTTRAEALAEYPNAKAVDVVCYNKLHWYTYRDVSVAMRNFFSKLTMEEPK